MTNDETLLEQSNEQCGMQSCDAASIEKDLRKRLRLLTGCGDFGGCNGANGIRYGCAEDAPNLCNRCLAFKELLRSKG